MTDTLNIFTGSTGLNTQVDPVRLLFDPQSGVQDLAVAYNVDHDATGRVSRRKGFSATIRTENIHSLWCDGGECLFANGTSLCVLNSDLTRTVVATITDGPRLSYAQVSNKAFWANGIETGYVQGTINHEWTAGTYYGPSTTRQYSGPPVGNHLAFFGGSVFVIQGNTAWHSEPFSLNQFDLVRNHYQFQTAIRMFCPVSDGIFVGTERNVYFLLGTSPRDLRRIPKSGYPPIEWTDARIPLEVIPSFQGMTQIGVIWTSTEGICVGLPDGQVLNLTKAKVSFPTSLRGAGIVIDKRYIVTLEP